MPLLLLFYPSSVSVVLPPSFPSVPELMPISTMTGDQSLINFIFSQCYLFCFWSQFSSSAQWNFLIHSCEATKSSPCVLSTFSLFHPFQPISSGCKPVPSHWCSERTHVLLLTTSIWPSSWPALFPCLSSLDSQSDACADLVLTMCPLW